MNPKISRDHMTGRIPEFPTTWVRIAQQVRPDNSLSIGAKHWTGFIFSAKKNASIAP